MYQLIKKAVLALSLVFITACNTTAPIMNVDNTAVVGDLTKAEVRKAIITAGVSRGWVMSDTNDHELRGTLALRTHQAVVRIPYSAKSYSIVFESSVNLKENRGRIHRNYNRWVKNLDTDIRRLMQLEDLKD